MLSKDFSPRRNISWDPSTTLRMTQAWRLLQFDNPSCYYYKARTLKLRTSSILRTYKQARQGSTEQKGEINSLVIDKRDAWPKTQTPFVLFFNRLHRRE